MDVLDGISPHWGLGKRTRKAYHYSIRVFLFICEFTLFQNDTVK